MSLYIRVSRPRRESKHAIVDGLLKLTDRIFEIFAEHVKGELRDVVTELWSKAIAESLGGELIARVKALSDARKLLSDLSEDEVRHVLVFTVRQIVSEDCEILLSATIHDENWRTVYGDILIDLEEHKSAKEKRAADLYELCLIDERIYKAIQEVTGLEGKRFGVINVKRAVLGDSPSSLDVLWRQYMARYRDLHHVLRTLIENIETTSRETELDMPGITLKAIKELSRHLKPYRLGFIVDTLMEFREVRETLETALKEHDVVIKRAQSFILFSRRRDSLRRACAYMIRNLAPVIKQLPADERLREIITREIHVSIRRKPIKGMLITDFMQDAREM